MAFHALATIAISILPAFAALYSRDAEHLWAEHRATDHPEAIQGDFVVHFHGGYTVEQHFQAIGTTFSAEEHGFRYNQWFDGYRAMLDDETLQLVRRDPGVQLVELNGLGSLDRPVDHGDDAIDPDFEDHPHPGAAAPAASQSLVKRYADQVVKGVTAGVRMVGTGFRIGSNKFDTTPVTAGDYPWLYANAAGVHVYVMDTGIRRSHFGFTGVKVENFHGRTHSPYVDLPMDDVDGHGTHVAGTIASWKYGVASSPTLVNVKVLNDTGFAYLEAVAYAVEEITADHNQFKAGINRPPGWRGSIINYSASSSFENERLKKAWDNAVKAGIPVVTAAGNSNQEASTKYPCAYLSTICVGATTLWYSKWENSNFGAKLFVMAPGKSIVSLSNKGDHVVRTLSGTSMATPHVSGAIAIWMDWEGVVNNVRRYMDLIVMNGRSDWMAGWRGLNTVDRFLNTGINLSGKDREDIPYIGGAPLRASRLNVDVDRQVNKIRADDAPSPAVTHLTTTFTQSFTQETGDKIEDPLEVIAPLIIAPTPTPYSRPQDMPSWEVSAWQGDADATGCGGNQLASVSGDAPSSCLKTTDTASCLIASIQNTTNACIVRIFSDKDCNKPLTLKGGFARFNWNETIVSGGNQFSSFNVICP